MTKPMHEYWVKIHLKDSYDILTVSVSATSRREAIRLIEEQYPTLELMYGKPKRTTGDADKNSDDWTDLQTVLSWFLPQWWRLGSAIVLIVVVVAIMTMCSGGG